MTLLYSVLSSSDHVLILFPTNSSSVRSVLLSQTSVTLTFSSFVFPLLNIILGTHSPSLFSFLDNYQYYIAYIIHSCQVICYPETSLATNCTWTLYPTVCRSVGLILNRVLGANLSFAAKVAQSVPCPCIRSKVTSLALNQPSATALEIVVSTLNFLAGTGGMTFSKPTVFVLSIFPEAGPLCLFTSGICLLVPGFAPAMFVCRFSRDSMPTRTTGKAFSFDPEQCVSSFSCPKALLC